MSELAREILKVASKAVKEAQRKSLKNGIANVYSKNGVLYFKLNDENIQVTKNVAINFSKSNLRICSTSDNAKNISIPSNNTSGIIGVSWCKQWNKWRAFVCIEGKYISLGYYKDKNDAIIARLKGEKEYYKEFAPQKHLFDLYLN